MPVTTGRAGEPVISTEDAAPARRHDRHGTDADRRAAQPSGQGVLTPGGKSGERAHVTKTLWPLQPGTIKLARIYGAALICVRYRHDASGLTRYTTVEVVIDSAPVGGKKADAREYAVQIRYDEKELRAAALRLGANWNPANKQWTMPGWLVKQLGLESRSQPVRPRTKRHRPYP